MTRLRTATGAALVLFTAVIAGPEGVPARAMPPAPAGPTTLTLAEPTAGPTAGPTVGPTVELDRDAVAIALGQKFTFTSTIRTDGAGPTSPAIAHLNVLGLDPDVYVDPEDWSRDRTRYLGALAPGSSTPVTWTVQGVTSGQVLVYVTVTEPDAGDAVVASPALRLDVGTQPTLPAGQGALPLALGVPGALLLLMIATARRRRLRSQPRPVPAGSRPGAGL